MQAFLCVPRHTPSLDDFELLIICTEFKIHRGLKIIITEQAMEKGGHCPNTQQFIS